MTIEIVRKWECGACNELHDREYEAEECCAPDITEVWMCPACDKAHEAKDEAAKCCPVSSDNVVTCPSCRRDHGIGSLGYSTVRVTGHCNFCNPIYTIDQQLAVQDLHYRQTGNREHLHD